MPQRISETIGKLGFGMMRLPMQNGEIDLNQVCEMADLFLEKGFNYFDTAYGYLDGRSEGAAKQAVVDRHPRDSFLLASKFPIWEVKEIADVQRIFDTQLRRTGAGYFDFYLIHAISAEKLPAIERFGIWDFVKKQKEKGLARHIGFSYHDSAALLDRLLSEHPECEFVQLQLNYLDWDSERIQSRRCYEVCREHGVPVIVMEPVKGGALAALPDEAAKALRAAAPERSLASWAMRFAASLDGVLTVLSGMSDLHQMRDNLLTMGDFQPLGESERRALEGAVACLRKSPNIPCTNCRYCTDGCPMKINIPDVFDAYNLSIAFGAEAGAGRYREAVKDGGRAGDCVRCGNCETQCPQHLEPMKWIAQCANLFDR